MPEILQNDNRRLIFVLAIASSFAPLSMDFFAPSMPKATRALQTTADSIQYTLYLFMTGYGLAPFLWGALADRVGRYKVMLAGIAIYGLASVGCFLASGVIDLAILRLLQGIGAASGVVISRAVLRDIHGSDGATKAISGMFLIMVWIPISAPVLGGFLAERFHWRLSFLVMSLVAFLTLAGVCLWQKETLPKRSTLVENSHGNWKAVLLSPLFARYALVNMFCIGTMLIFLSNYSYLSERYYQLSSSENGYLLGAFNAAIALGVYLVRILAPRLGVEKTINLGIRLAFSGWLLIWGLGFQTVPAPSILLPLLLLACIGTGLVISLTVGQALIPFTYTTGVASALFICVQSAGASVLSLLATSVSSNSLTSITGPILLCSLLAMASRQFIKPGAA